MRGLISPTVIKAISCDPLWHDKYIALYGGENGFDSDGFDCFGYDINGVDRAGYKPHHYFYQKSYDEDDFEYDHGCHIFHETYHKFGIVNIHDLFVPTLLFSHNLMYNSDYQHPLNHSSIYDLEDGSFNIIL